MTAVWSIPWEVQRACCVKSVIKLSKEGLGAGEVKERIDRGEGRRDDAVLTSRFVT